MKFNLAKMHSSGNSFVVCCMDPRKFNLNNIIRLCDPHFGMGADGLVLIDETKRENAYHLYYFNNDGTEFNMCFNGTLCGAMFLKLMSKSNKKLRLYAKKFGNVEVEFYGNIVSLNFLPPNVRTFSKEISMPGLSGICHSLFLTDNHKVFQGDFKLFDSNLFISVAKELRANDELFPEGSNVHFVNVNSESVYIRHFEKGIEGETLSCGSGCVAAALILKDRKILNFQSLGGKLKIEKKNILWIMSGQPQLISWLILKDHPLY